MKRLPIIIFFLLSSAGLCAQSTNITTFFMNDFQKAEIYFEKSSYKNAIELYERVLDKNPNNYQSKLRIAECFTLMNDPKNAVKWYSQIADFKDIPSIHVYDYAQALSMLEKYDEATFWYDIYSQMNDTDSRAVDKLQFLDKIKDYQRDSSYCFIAPMPFNSENSDFGGVPYKKGLLFLSARDQDLFIKYRDADYSARDEETPSEARLDLYYTYFEDTAYIFPVKLHDINTRFHEGPLAFFNQSNQVIFTRNNFTNNKKKVSSDGKIYLKMYTSYQDKDDEWTEFVPFPYNNDEYSVGHPTLSKDDQILYFSSDMPGGLGGSDIYFCQRQKGNWGQPVNMGAEINTMGDELFPFISHDNKLYFSSDGHGGLGGLDVYRSYQQDPITYGSVENLGAPWNSSSDDFSFYLNKDGRTGYFSSNRPGGKGSDDIYEFSIKYLGIAGTVIDSRINEPIPFATIIIRDSILNQEIEVLANENGFFNKDLPIDSWYTIMAKKAGYTSEGFFSLNTDNNLFGIDTVNVFMWKHELFAEGRIFSNESHELLTEAVVTIENYTDDTTEQVITGEKGSYRFILRPNKKYMISAELAKHEPSSFNLNTTNMLIDTLRNDFVLEESYEQKDLIFFDFDKYAIKEEAKPHLDVMIKALKKHKDAAITVSAHADAQGTFEYNKKLSDLRAKTVVAYLRANGISNNRIIWYGFGEELLLNRCSDGVECPDEDHSKNRRAELKIGDSKKEPVQ